MYFVFLNTKFMMFKMCQEYLIWKLKKRKSDVCFLHLCYFLIQWGVRWRVDEEVGGEKKQQWEDSWDMLCPAEVYVDNSSGKS